MHQIKAHQIKADQSRADQIRADQPVDLNLNPERIILDMIYPEAKVFVICLKK
jgi:hypothetical protein